MTNQTARLCCGAGLVLVAAIVLGPAGGCSVKSEVTTIRPAAPVLAQVVSSGRNWYVAPHGRPDAKGTKKKKPLDLVTVLRHPEKIKPGDTIWLRGGTYGSGGNTVFRSDLTGTASEPIILRQFPGERAIIDGGIDAYGAHTWFWGFEITNTSTERYVGENPVRPAGLNLLGPGHKAINLVIHNTGHPGIGFWSVVGDGGEIYGCIIWGVGVWDTTAPYGTPSNPGRRGSAIYAQNREGTRYIKDNITFRNFTTGMKAWGGDTNGFQFEGNIVFDNTSENLFVGANGNPTRRLRVTNNFSYNRRHKSGSSVNLGVYAPGVFDPGVDVVVQDNYFVNGYFEPWPDAQGNYPQPVLAVKDFADVTVRNNILVGSFIEWFSNPSRVVNEFWNNNSYYAVKSFGRSVITGVAADDRHRYERSIEAWRGWCRCDQESTATSDYPAKNVVAVRANSYEPGRAHIVVFNWAGKSSVAVDLSGVLSIGDNYELRDAQNYFGPPVLSGTFAGEQVSIPLNLSDVSPITGVLGSSFVNEHTAPEFAVFVLLRR